MNTLKKITNWIKKEMADLLKAYDTSTKEDKLLKELDFKSLTFWNSKAKVYDLSVRVEGGGSWNLLDKDGNEIFIPNNSVFTFKGMVSYIEETTGATRADEFSGVVKRYGGVINIVAEDQALVYWEGAMNAFILDIDVSAGQNLRINVDTGFVMDVKVSAIIYGTLATI